jgi:hypothetical protein
MSDCQTGTKIPYIGKTGEIYGKNPNAKAGAPIYSSVCVFYF